MRFVSTLFLFLTSLTLVAGEMRGYVIGQGSFTKKPIFLKEYDRSEITNINRFNYIHRFPDDSSFEAGLEINQIFEKNDLAQISPYLHKTKYPFRIKQFNEYLINRNNMNSDRYFSQGHLDRLVYNHEANSFSVTVGRQQISFGSSKVVNPLDMFAPFNVVTINKEERNGVDALRLRIPYRQMGEWDFAVVAGEDFEGKKSAALAAFKFSINSTDLKLMAMHFKQAEIFGIDLLTTLFDANFWLEGTTTKPKGEESYQRVTAGGEYQWSEKLYTTLEYHYNGAGFDNLNFYYLKTDKFAFNDGGVYLLNKNYLNFIMGYQLAPLDTLMLSLLYCGDDQSVLLSPSFESSLSENLNLIVGAFIGIGDENSSLTDLNSELKGYGKTFFVKLRQFF